MVMKKATFSVTLDMELMKEVETLAIKEDRSRSWMLNKLIEEGLAVHGKQNSTGKRTRG